MAGNHVVLDIGDGRYVLYGHMKQEASGCRWATSSGADR
jgi:murein DD-endopeptidase MepM/ murein hydrolase activator NlpD